MVDVWNRFLVQETATVSPTLAALLLAAGIIILLLGWRLGRLVATLDFSIFGLCVGGALMPDGGAAWLGASIGAVAFGLLSLWLNQYSEGVAAGLVAGLATGLVMSWLGAEVPAIILGMVLTAGFAVAFSLVVAREATAVMTAVQGGLLVAFGLAACLAYSPGICSGVRDVLAGNGLALAMFMAAPIGLGVSFQLAAIQNEKIVA